MVWIGGSGTVPDTLKPASDIAFLLEFLIRNSFCFGFYCIIVLICYWIVYPLVLDFFVTAKEIFFVFCVRVSLIILLLLLLQV
jgi:hypothetical protein